MAKNGALEQVQDKLLVFEALASFVKLRTAVRWEKPNVPFERWAKLAENVRRIGEGADFNLKLPSEDDTSNLAKIFERRR